MNKKEIFNNTFQIDWENLKKKFFAKHLASSKTGFHDHFYSCENSFLLEYANGKVLTDLVSVNCGFSNRKIMGEKVEFSSNSLPATKGRLKPESVKNINPGLFNIKKRLSLIQKAEKNVLNKTVLVEGLAFKWEVSDTITAVLNSDGFAHIKFATLVHMSIKVKIRINKSYFDGYCELSLPGERDYLDHIKIIDLVNTAILDAENAANAVHLENHVYDVLFSNHVGSLLFHEITGHLMEADYIFNDQSILKNLIGQKLSDNSLVLIDSALENGAVNFSFDDEGSENKETVIIENGILHNMLTDKYHSMLQGIELTGNGRRKDYQKNVLPRMTNMIIQPGKYEKEEIIKSVNKGVYITRLGNGNVSTLSGDCNFTGVGGQLIENGKLSHPVRDLKLQGNALKIMQSVKMIGNDMSPSMAHSNCEKEDQYIPVGFIQPTIKIAGLQINQDLFFD